MLNSIYIGMSGLKGYSQGLRVISNNAANLNTPGYKGSTLQLADMFHSNQEPAGPGRMQLGYGLNTTGTALNFQQGELRQTGNNLDLGVDGQGLFTVEDADGKLHYTRAGQFSFNVDGVLVNRADGSKVMGLDENGQLHKITIAGSQASPGKATTTVKFTGNVSSTATDKTISDVKVMDNVGGEHLLTVTLTNNNTTTPGEWTVQVLDGTTVVGSGSIRFSDGTPDSAQCKFNVTYKPTGVAEMPLAFDFSTDVTSFASGNQSTLAFTSQDGLIPGALTGVSFDSTGALVMAYSNGQKIEGAQLALGRFDSLDAVATVGNNQFDATNSSAWHTGVAGGNGFGSIRAGMVELSNVDMSQEFSDLVIMQRGYQASSQVISTANTMLEDLFQMARK